MKPTRSRGFTLLELSVALALVAVLAGMAIPTFRQSLRNAAVRTAAHELMTGLQQARAAAILESRPGMLCLADAAGRCHDSAGATAWAAFLDAEGAPRTIAVRALPAGITLQATRTPIRFSARALAASTSTLTLCDAQGIATPRAIVISQTARARFSVASEAACRP